MDRTSLEGLAHKLLEFAAAGPAGRSASTVYGGREQVLRQTLIALTAGTSLSEHENPGEATVQVLLGRVRLLAGAASWEGRPGDLIVIPRGPARAACRGGHRGAAHRRQDAVTTGPPRYPAARRSSRPVWLSGRQRRAAWQGAQNRACGRTSRRWAGMALPQRSHRPYVP
jgi:hypothetical protein